MKYYYIFCTSISTYITAAMVGWTLYMFKGFIATNLDDFYSHKSKWLRSLVLNILYLKQIKITECWNYNFYNHMYDLIQEKYNSE